MRVDRNQPKRAASSESQYSLMEFTARFPDDLACLEWLWRTRFAPDGEHATCPKCEQSGFSSGTNGPQQSWTCTGLRAARLAAGGHDLPQSSTSLHLWFYAMYIMRAHDAESRPSSWSASLRDIQDRLAHVPPDPSALMTRTMSRSRRGRDGRLRPRARARSPRKVEPVLGRMQAGRQGPGQETAGVGNGRAWRQGRRARRAHNWQASAFQHIEKRVLDGTMIFTDEPRLRPLESRGYTTVAPPRHQGVRGRRRAHEHDRGFWALVKNASALAPRRLGQAPPGLPERVRVAYNFRDDPRSMFELLLAVRRSRGLAALYADGRVGLGSLPPSRLARKQT